MFFFSSLRAFFFALYEQIECFLFNRKKGDKRKYISRRIFVELLQIIAFISTSFYIAGKKKKEREAWVNYYSNSSTVMALLSSRLRLIWHHIKSAGKFEIA